MEYTADIDIAQLIKLGEELFKVIRNIPGDGGGGEIIGCDPEQEFLAVQQTTYCSNSYLT